MIEPLKSKRIALLIILCLSGPLLYFSLVAMKSFHGAPEIGPENYDRADGNGYDSPAHLADLQYPAIKESSGLAASAVNANLLWTHNDSGDGPFVYTFDRRGKHRGVWRVTGANARDWEDMAIGPGPQAGRSYIYIGDIGDNSKKRDEIIVYRVAEPSITAEDSSSTNQNPRETAAADPIRLKYPDGKHDAEALLIHPSTGDLYIVTKVRGAAAGVYKLRAPLPESGVSTLARVGEVRFPNPLTGFITGGAIAPDGRRIILCDYLGGCEMVLDGERGNTFDDIWKQPLIPIGLGARQQGEAICYSADGMALLATSEGLPCPIVEVARRARTATQAD